MIDRSKIILKSATSKELVNTDSYMKIYFESTGKLLPSGEINKIINVSERFNIERQSSGFYRLLGTIFPLMSNPLLNITGPNSWITFSGETFLDQTFPHNNIITDTEDLTYNQSIKKYLKEVDGWFGYFDPDITKAGLCNFFDMEPTRNRFSFLPNNGIKNWDLTITYPFSTDKSHFIVNNGLFIFDKQDVIVNHRNMVALGVTVSHNLSIGDSIRISGTNLDGDYLIVRTGLDNGDFKNNYFVIDVDPNNLFINDNSRFKKLFAGQESEYYIRLFKKIKTRVTDIIEADDYDIYKLAFSQNIYNDPILQFAFNEDINISELTDNLGRPLSEIYLTTIKTNSSDGIFSFGKTSSGLEVPFMGERLNTSSDNATDFLRNIPVISKIHNDAINPFPTHIPFESDLSINDDIFFGDVVEYNKFNVKETILGDVHHRFNTTNREMLTIGGLPPQGPRQEGYYYKAHHLIKIREFSNYIEQGDSSTLGIPSYAENLGDGRFLWRDLLDIGFNDTKEHVLNYPFLNGCHYLHDNYCFTVKRQDPFGHWGLYYKAFPSDIIGDPMQDNFIINKEDDVC